MGKDQVSGTLDRGLAVLATILLGKLVEWGYLGATDAATLVPFVVLLPSMFWGWWVNRPKALLQSAANVVGADGKKTVVLASPEIANAMPEKNIVSNTSTPEKVAAAVAEAAAPQPKEINA